MSVVEGWIVEDSEKDKSANYGKQYPKGTFVAMMKVDNDDVWNKVKSGEIKGFSIDALLKLQEINLNTEIQMNKEAQTSLKDDILNGIKALFNSQNEVDEVKEVEEIEVQPEVETVVEEPAFDAEQFARDLKETLSVEFKSQLEKVELEKQKEIDALKVELGKQAETEDVVITPEVKKSRIKRTKNKQKRKYQRPCFC